MRAEPGPVEVIPLSRRWLCLVATVALALSFGSSPGQISPDTKLDLTANPLRFLARATNLWNSQLPFGQAQNQAYGYLFPHGTFFVAGHLLGLPGWITQRLWWALLLTVGFWGLLRVAEALGIGSPTSRAVAAAAFALSPRVLTTLGSISSETLPIMLAPWVLLPTILALRDSASSGPSVRRLAGQAGVAVALMGAVNAIATLAGCLPAVIWWACHRPNRRWLRYAAWWLLALALAMTWWLVALILMARISPPFLDFIESSGVTTQWSSLVEVLRGTDSWTPFVAPNATAGAPLVTGSVAILATCLVAAAGLAGLGMGSMPARGRLVTMLFVGVVLLGVGYSGGLGSPLAQHVQAFLDAGGAPLRNVHKFESLIRIPVVLGLAQLLGRIPLPGSVPKPVWRSAFAHPERDKRVAVGIVVLTALMAGTSLAWTGRMTPPGTYSAIPRYWHDAADWLSAHNTGVPAPGRVLVVPGAPFATQLWGTSHDEPLQVLGDSPWGVRDSIPLTPPQTIRALDSVQRLFASGTPSAGLADTLARQGISYVVMRNDLDPDASRSARPILVHRAIIGSPRLQKVAQFGAPVGPGPLSGFVTDSELRPRYPAVEIYRVTAMAGDPGAPYLADINGLPRVDGGPEALLRLDERRRLSGRPPLGPALLTADAVRASLPVPVVTVTDTPLARETDYGRVDDHSSAIRAVGDTRHTFNRVPDYPSPGADTVYGSWTGGRLTASSSSSDSTVLPDVATAASPAAAIDADSATAWVSNSLQSAVGQWLQVDFDHPVTNSIITITPSATTVGAQVRRVEVETATGTTTLRFARGAVRDHRLVDHPIRRSRLRASGQYSAHRARSRSATERRCGAMGSGFRSAGQTGLRGGPDKRAMRAVDGAGDRNTHNIQSHAERSAADVGAADGMGPRQVGTQTGRSGRRAGHHPGSRRLRSGRRPRRGLRRHRRRPGHRVDGTAASGAAQDATDADPHPAPTHRSDRSASHAQHVAGARAPDHGGRRPRRRSAGPGVENIGATGPVADAPDDRHHHGEPA
jgi:arabinofuranan 3-O-arabinosyltransferase